MQPPPKNPQSFPIRDGKAIRNGDASTEPFPDTRFTARPDISNEAALPSRRHPAHGIKYVEGQPTIIFDTFCVKDRHPILATKQFHHAFSQIASEATAWLIGRYVIMPDHIHFFAGDIGGNIAYENWVTYLKSQLTKTLGGRVSRRAALQVRWLPNHWDTRGRNAVVYEQKWQYFLTNPVRAGLVARPEDWPYQGEIYELRW